MGKIYEEIDIDGKKVKVKIDTGSDFALCLKKEVIKKLGLKKHPKAYAILKTEEGDKKSPAYLANIKIGCCKFGVPQLVVEAFGEDNLLGHPILQSLQAKVDEEKHKIVFDCDKCPIGNTGEKTGEIKNA